MNAKASDLKVDINKGGNREINQKAVDYFNDSEKTVNHDQTNVSTLIKV